MNITKRKNGRESKIREHTKFASSLRVSPSLQLAIFTQARVFYSLYYWSLGKMMGFKLLPERAREGNMRRGENTLGHGTGGFSIRGFRFWSSLTRVSGLRMNTCRPVADETKLPDAREKKTSGTQGRERRRPVFFFPLAHARPRNFSFRQRFLKFTDFSLTNVKFPWPTEITLSQIMLPSQPSLPFIFLTFQQVKCGVHKLIVPSHNVQKELTFFPKPNISLLFNFMNNILPIQHDSCP